MGKLSTYDVKKILSSLTKKQTNKKAVIYAQYSSHNQREESIDAQLRAMHSSVNAMITQKETDL